MIANVHSLSSQRPLLSQNKRAVCSLQRADSAQIIDDVVMAALDGALEHRVSVPAARGVRNLRWGGEGEGG
jgi:hypothetical protein